jgi:hypothetical protein
LRPHMKVEDAASGVLDAVDWRSIDPPLEALCAAQERFGNISTIGSLRNWIQDQAPGCRVLLDQVLYDGTHSGDFIPLSQMESLNRELEQIRQLNVPDYVDYFLTQMTSLARVAQAEQNAIVFA